MRNQTSKRTHRAEPLDVEFSPIGDWWQAEWWQHGEKRTALWNDLLELQSDVKHIQRLLNESLSDA